MKGSFLLYLRIKMLYLPELFSNIFNVLSRTSVINLRTARETSSLQSSHFHKVMTAQGNNAIGPSRIR
jgi:hypothetical protein